MQSSMHAPKSVPQKRWPYANASNENSPAFYVYTHGYMCVCKFVCDYHFFSLLHYFPNPLTDPCERKFVLKTAPILWSIECGSSANCQHSHMHMQWNAVAGEESASKPHSFTHSIWRVYFNTSCMHILHFRPPVDTPALPLSSAVAVISFSGTAITLHLLHTTAYDPGNALLYCFVSRQ